MILSSLRCQQTSRLVTALPRYFPTFVSWFLTSILFFTIIALTQSHSIAVAVTWHSLVHITIGRWIFDFPQDDDACWTTINT